MMKIKLVLLRERWEWDSVSRADIAHPSLAAVNAGAP